MEKTIYVDDVPVKLKSTAATPLRYKAQFGVDYFSDLFKLAKVFDGVGTQDENEIDLSVISWEKISYLDFQVIYNFVWVLAKSADPSIPEPIEWLDQFDTFPIKELLPQVTDLLSNSIQSKKKVTNLHPAMKS